MVEDNRVAEFPDAKSQEQAEHKREDSGPGELVLNFHAPPSVPSAERKGNLPWVEESTTNERITVKSLSYFCG